MCSYRAFDSQYETKEGRGLITIFENHAAKQIHDKVNNGDVK